MMFRVDRRGVGHRSTFTRSRDEHLRWSTNRRWTFSSARSGARTIPIASSISFFS